MNGSSTWELLAVIKNLAGPAQNTEWMTRNQKEEKPDQPQTCWWGHGGGLKSRRRIFWSPKCQYLTKWEWDSTINYRINLTFNIGYFKTGHNILYQYDFVIMIWSDDIFLDFGYVVLLLSFPCQTTSSNTCERTTSLQHCPNINIKVFGQKYH